MCWRYNINNSHQPYFTRRDRTITALSIHLMHCKNGGHILVPWVHVCKQTDVTNPLIIICLSVPRKQHMCSMFVFKSNIFREEIKWKREKHILKLLSDPDPFNLEMSYPPAFFPQTWLSVEKHFLLDFIDSLSKSRLLWGPRFSVSHRNGVMHLFDFESSCGFGCCSCSDCIYFQKNTSLLIRTGLDKLHGGFYFEGLNFG